MTTHTARTHPADDRRASEIVMRARTIAEEIDLDPQVATILCGRVEEIMDGTVATETAATIADSLDDYGYESLAGEIREWFPSDDPREDDPTIYDRSTH